MGASKYTAELQANFDKLVDGWDPFKDKKSTDKEIIEEFFDKGYVVSLAVHLGVYRGRIRDYREKHPAFKETYEKWRDKRDHYFHKLAKCYKDYPTQWIYISKNILGWSDNPAHTDTDDNTLPDLIRAIEGSAKKIQAKKRRTSRSRKK